MNDLRKDDANIIEPSKNATNQNNSANTKTIDAIRGALNNILSDDKFLASPQMSAFLIYVVQETIAGNSDRIKAYTVAVDALGKPTSFDPQNDPSVRVLANRLRSSLDNYYASNPEQTLFIEIYRGSYVPHFIDATSYEHLHNILKSKSADANTPLIKQYDEIENLYAPHSNLRGANAIQRERQSSTDSVNRISSWLLSGGKKYG